MEQQSGNLLPDKFIDKLKIIGGGIGLFVLLYGSLILALVGLGGGYAG